MSEVGPMPSEAGDTDNGSIYASSSVSGFTVRSQDICLVFKVLVYLVGNF